MASQPGITCALFVLGATLSYHKIHADWKPVFAMSVTKLFALPFIAWWFSHHILQLDKQTVIIITLMLASPSGMNAWLMAAQYQQHEGRVASTVVVSSLASIVYCEWLAGISVLPAGYLIATMVSMVAHKGATAKNYFNTACSAYVSVSKTRFSIASRCSSVMLSIIFSHPPGIQ